MARRHPGEGQGDDQDEQPEQGEEEGAERPEPVVQRARQGEDAGADHAVERQEGGAEEADVAAKGFVLGLAVTDPPSRRLAAGSGGAALRHARAFGVCRAGCPFR